MSWFHLLTKCHIRNSIFQFIGSKTIIYLRYLIILIKPLNIIQLKIKLLYYSNRYRYYLYLLEQYRMKLMHDSLWNLARIAKHTLGFQHLVIIMHILTLKEISKIKNIRWYEYKKQPKDPYYLMFFYFKSYGFLEIYKCQAYFLPGLDMDLVIFKSSFPS